MNGFAIKRHLAFGGVVYADVFEYELRNPATGAWLSDAKVASTLAVALRLALAALLGVDEREIGCAVNSRQEGGGRRRSIVLFDTVDGGAGYVGRCPELLGQMLQGARRRLDCPLACDAACHACLVTYSNQNLADQLDRHEAIHLLSEDFLAAFELPQSHRYFGDTSQFEARGILLAMLEESQLRPIDQARLYLAGTAGNWLFEDWEAWRYVQRWAIDGVKVTLLVPKALLNELDRADAENLRARLETFANLELREVAQPVAARHGGYLIAEVGSPTSCVRWAATDSAMLSPNDVWPALEEGRRIVLERGSQLEAMGGRPLTAKDLERPNPGQFKRLKLGARLEGPVNQVGRRFWGTLISEFVPLAQRLTAGTRIEAVRYVDRYIRSPLNARLVLEVLKALSEQTSGMSDGTRVELRTSCGRPRYGTSSTWLDEWKDSERQRHVLQQLLANAVAPASMNVVIGTTRQTDHARSLMLRFDDGVEILVALDHGLTFLDFKDRSMLRFDFGDSVDDQVREIASCIFKLGNRQGEPAIAYIGITR